MLNLALDLASDIESYLTDDLCSVNHVGITYGEPAAPATDGPCREIWVWLNRVEDRHQFDAQCSVATLVTLSYRIYSCYDPEATNDQHVDAADCLYELVRAVWCGLVRDKDTGDLMNVGDCDQIVLGPLVTDQPLGGITSATGTVVIDYACPVS